MKTLRKHQSEKQSSTSNPRFPHKLALLFGAILIGAAMAIIQWQSPVAAAAETASADAAAGGAFTVMVDPTATFLHTAMSDDHERCDNPAMPAIVDLAAAGFAPGAEVKLSFQVQQPFSFNCNLAQPKHEDPTLIAVFSKSPALLTPDAIVRVPDAVKAGDEIRTGPVGLAEQSEPDDIHEDFEIMPVTGTTVRVPEGAAYLFLGVADSFYRDNCGQIAVVLERPQFFDVCLQDNISGDTLLFNSFTGDYRFIRCGAEGFVYNNTGGRRAIARKGCAVTLNDGFVSAVVDVCNNRGSATIKNPNLVGATFQIQDSYTKDNTCGCR